MMSQFVSIIHTFTARGKLHKVLRAFFLRCGGGWRGWVCVCVSWWSICYGLHFHWAPCARVVLSNARTLSPSPSFRLGIKCADANCTRVQDGVCPLCVRAVVLLSVLLMVSIWLVANSNQSRSRSAGRRTHKTNSHNCNTLTSTPRTRRNPRARNRRNYVRAH